MKQGSTENRRSGCSSCFLAGIVILGMLLLMGALGSLFDLGKDSKKTTKTETESRAKVTDENVAKYFAHLEATYGTLIDRYYDNRPFSIVIHVPAISARAAKLMAEGEAREFYEITGKSIVIRVVDPNNKEYRGLYP